MDKENTKSNNSLDSLEYNVVAAFAYLIPFITGIVFFLMEKENKFIRFHAIQAVLFWIAVFAAFTLADTLNILRIGFFLYPFIKFAALTGWLFLMWKAYNKEEYQLPYIGKIARDFTNK